MQILEYKLDASPEGMRCPSWVEDGGYFTDPDNHTMVGKCRDNQEWKIPDSVVKLTLAQLKDRLVDIHSRYPFKDAADPVSDPVTLTVNQVKQLATSWAG